MGRRRNHYYTGDRRGYSRTGAPRSAPDARALWWLAGINLAVFVLYHLAPASWAPALAQNLWVHADTVTAGKLWTPLTSAFTHFDTQHLLFNLLGLYVFGQPVLAHRGERDLVGLYLVGGVLASMAHVALSLWRPETGPAIGASGAVMALAVAAAWLVPRRQLLLFFVVPMPMLLAVGLYIALDLFGVAVDLRDGIAHAAHLGGALAGGVWALRQPGGTGGWLKRWRQASLSSRR